MYTRTEVSKAVPDFLFHPLRFFTSRIAAVLRCGHSRKPSFVEGCIRLLDPRRVSGNKHRLITRTHILIVIGEESS